MWKCEKKESKYVFMVNSCDRKIYEVNPSRVLCTSTIATFNQLDYHYWWCHENPSSTLGRGGDLPNNRNIDKDHNPLRNRSISISKFLAKYFTEGNLVSHIEGFEQICDTPRDVEVLDKVSTFGLSLEGKAHQWYNTLGIEEKINWATLMGIFT